VDSDGTACKQRSFCSALRGSSSSLCCHIEHHYSKQQALEQKNYMVKRWGHLSSNMDDFQMGIQMDNRELLG
jgi:hypothetical protein